MTSFGLTLTKTAFFAIGALAGALLTEWLDKLLATRAQEQSEYDSSPMPRDCNHALGHLLAKVIKKP